MHPLNLKELLQLNGDWGPKMVEVDLRLFVTCRLCLDVQGHFQIDPKVQQQIKYCFDIDKSLKDNMCDYILDKYEVSMSFEDILRGIPLVMCASFRLFQTILPLQVEPFDGLPQLICKKCENILREHYAIKISFTEKQKELKTKLQCNAKKGEKSPSPQRNDICKKNKFNNKYLSKLDDSDTSNIKDEYHEKTTRKKKKVKKKRIINRLMSSSDELEPDASSDKQMNRYSKTDSSYKNHTAWDANFNKYFVCRICSEGFQDKEGITQHIKTHSHLIMKYENIFKMSCIVAMEKSDIKPNFCNSKKTVVYSSDSIIQNNHNPFYYIWYHPKTHSNVSDTFKPMSEKNVCSSETMENKIFSRKRRRLLSRSSSETVVINRDSEDEDAFEENVNPPTVIDCIELGDSSDNGSRESDGKSSNSTNKSMLDSKPMQNIIKMCHNKYTKKLDSLEKKYSENYKGKEDFLQHKVLSIGRKIINNKGFSCTGLLRFLEYKDLSVIWKETSVLNARTDSKYVRIATRVRGNESSETNNVEWKNFKTFTFGDDDTLPSSNVLKKLKTFSDFKKKTNLKPVANEEGDSNSLEYLPRISSVFSHTDLEITKTDDNLLLKKLLNENPVSNPKQLPKKANNESYAKTMKVFSAPNTLPATTKQSEKNKEAEVNTMPIVISIESLAPVADKEKKIPPEESKNTLSNQQTYPRIKVKPVSELMPNNSATNTISNDVNGGHNAPQIVMWPTAAPGPLNTSQWWPTTHNETDLVSNPQMWQNRNDSLIQPKTSEQYKAVTVDNVSQSSKASDSPKVYMILDTVELPNTKTSSPFQYLKDLLLVHNIILVCGDQPTGSVSLIKMKLVYEQDKCLPVTLWLSLLCCRNTFCIQVKDETNLLDVDVNRLSANWQWQLLKIYDREMINKVLQTAEKVGHETYKYTKEFFALLKSIKAKYEEL